MFPKHFFLLLFLCTFFKVFAQPALSDSIIFKNILKVYQDSLGINARLYSGREYIGYVKRPEGHPFFGSENMQTGDIFYDGVMYHFIPMLYDLVSDDVIIHDYTGNNLIKLVREKITYFNFSGHEFIQMRNDSAASTGGFYERLYNGRSTVLVKRKKQVNSIPNQMELISRYQEYDYYFLKLDGNYYKVINRNSLLSIFKNKKSQIRSFIKKNNLKFKKDMSSALTKIAMYYDSLKP